MKSSTPSNNEKNTHTHANFVYASNETICGHYVDIILANTYYANKKEKEKKQSRKKKETKLRLVKRGRSAVPKYTVPKKAGKFQNNFNAFSKEREITDANF